MNIKKTNKWIKMGYRSKERILKRGNANGWKTLKEMCNIGICKSKVPWNSLLFQSECLRSIRQMTAHAVRVRVKWNNHSLLVGFRICTTPMEISVVDPQEAVINLPQGPAISLMSIYPQDDSSCYRDTAQLCSLLL